MHEPQTACIAKGRAHKAYEFGTKVCVVRGIQTGVITSVKRFAGNPHDSNTLEESLAQSERVRKYIGGTRPSIAGTEVNRAQILIPKKQKRKFKIQTGSCQEKI